MNLNLADKIAKAVLYEGYILYPYRPGTFKNQQRWTFGGLFPPAFREAHGSDADSLQAECILLGGAESRLDIRLRCLQLQERVVGQLEQPLPALPEGPLPAYRSVDRWQLGERTYYGWQEATEREVAWTGLRLDELLDRPHQMDFTFPAREAAEPLRGPSGEVAGLLVHRQQAVQGRLDVHTQARGEGAYQITVQASNQTPLPEAAALTRDQAALWSLASTHLLLGAYDGEFISLIDPPSDRRELAAGCQQAGVWPVLVGEAGERDLLLAAPIILYDYPEIAPGEPRRPVRRHRDRRNLDACAS